MIENPRDMGPACLLRGSKLTQRSHQLMTRTSRRSDELDQGPVGVPLPVCVPMNPFEKHARDLLSNRKIMRFILYFKRGIF